MSIYFFTTYIKDLFKIKKKKTSNIVTFIVGILGILLVGKTMRYSTVSLYFARHQFVFFISLVLFIIFVITFISVFIRKRLEKKTT
jgi:predicted lipid-binding transport protein (Tim44 family)